MLTTHEPIDGCRTVEHRLYVSGDRSVVIETITKLLSLVVKIFDEAIDVVFAMRAVETATIESGVQTVTEVVCLVFDSMKNPIYLFVVQSIRLADHLCLRTCCR